MNKRPADVLITHILSINQCTCETPNNGLKWFGGLAALPALLLHSRWSSLHSHEPTSTGSRAAPISLNVVE